MPMISLDLVGIGAWSDCFADWSEMRGGFESGNWASEASLIPEAIPARERRRAPRSVKMAVEVLSQACAMAEMSPSSPAVVFSSAMGDIDITDAMCSILADKPELVSPTRFHNSVHNAPIGYWSIAMQSHTAATAVAGHDNSAALGLLEAAVQCAEENVPVVSLCQEGAAPPTLQTVRPSLHPLALALLLAPEGYVEHAVARISLDVTPEAAHNPALRSSMPVDFSGNPAAALLPVFEALAGQGAAAETRRGSFRIPLNEHCSLVLEIELEPLN